MIQLKRVLLVLSFAVIPYSVAWYDNRYLPLILPAPILKEGRDSYFTCEVFALSSDQAVSACEEIIGVPEIYGAYDQGNLANSFVAAGCQNPLKTEWRGVSIPWFVDGNIKGQGCTLTWRQAVSRHCQVGAAFFAMRLDSWEMFELNKDEVHKNLLPGDAEMLGEYRRSMHRQIGLLGDHAHEVGIGDIDFYARLSNRWDYTLKCRSIYAGVRVGAIAPTAQKHNYAFPTWIPFGGEGCWGFYSAIDAEFEVREDLKIGAMLRAGIRKSRTHIMRVPALNEPQQFGVLMGPVSIDPGATFNFEPYISLEGIREGLGIRLIYTLTAHRYDSFFDVRPDKFERPGNIQKLQDNSRWATDYVSLNIFYDFGKVKSEDRVLPILTFCWDIPMFASVSLAQRACKTNRISCGLAINF